MNTQSSTTDSRDRLKLDAWQAMESRLAVYLASFSGLSREDREDVLQSTFASFWSSGPSAEKDARPWLYRVARNAAIDAQRRLRRGSAVLGRSGVTRQGASRPEAMRPGMARLEAVTGDALDEAADSAPGPEDRALSGEDAAFVRNFLAGLSDRERELAFLAFSEDQSYERIAALTGTPLGTVKWRLAGVKKRLAESYRREMS